MFKHLTLFACSLTLIACAPVGKIQPTSYIEPTTGMEFVSVPGGSFVMGDATGQSPNESPARKIDLPAFHVGRYEVTFDQYDMFCQITGREKPDDNEWGRENRPAINVSWDDAVAMAAWLKEQTGLPFSLPSEAQWEYAARAGTTTPYWTGEILPPNQAVCFDCGSQWDNKSTAPVGQFPPNPWGVYDTVGNAIEWCLDDMHTNYDDAPHDSTPWLNPEDNRKIQRGGAYLSYRTDSRSFVRDWQDPTTKYPMAGFRLVINLSTPIVKAN